MSNVSELKKAAGCWFGRTEDEMAVYVREFRALGLFPTGHGGRNGAHSARISEVECWLMLVALMTREPSRRAALRIVPGGRND